MALDDVGSMATSSGMRGYLPALGLSWLYGRGGGGRGAGGGGRVTPRRELENQTIALQNREQIGINAQGQSLNQQVRARMQAQAIQRAGAGIGYSKSEETAAAPAAAPAAPAAPARKPAAPMTGTPRDLYRARLQESKDRRAAASAKPSEATPAPVSAKIGATGTLGPLASIQFGTLLGGTPASGQTAFSLGSETYAAAPAQKAAPVQKAAPAPAKDVKVKPAKNDVGGGSWYRVP
jgi:hypothetical protein